MTLRAFIQPDGAEEVRQVLTVGAEDQMRLHLDGGCGVCAHVPVLSVADCPSTVGAAYAAAWGVDLRLTARRAGFARGLQGTVTCGSPLAGFVQWPPHARRGSPGPLQTLAQADNGVIGLLAGVVGVVGSLPQPGDHLLAKRGLSGDRQVAISGLRQEFGRVLRGRSNGESQRYEAFLRFMLYQPKGCFEPPDGAGTPSAMMTSTDSR